ncbi:hypothetical protein TCON_0571 [Astathelohania contejeani]|uniref:Uncharacterized protein n=1 Tax=Astathelohania contejeani TaxID=164912 RepID=A0ABQ7I1H7_9MICR|nr:hypothetical protein TCON_0571 [Thelohania contejeani]
MNFKLAIITLSSSIISGIMTLSILFARKHANLSTSSFEQHILSSDILIQKLTNHSMIELEPTNFNNTYPTTEFNQNVTESTIFTAINNYYDVSDDDIYDDVYDDLQHEELVYTSIDLVIPEITFLNYKDPIFNILFYEEKLKSNGFLYQFNEINTCVFDPNSLYETTLSFNKTDSQNITAVNTSNYDDFQKIHYWINYSVDNISKTYEKLTSIMKYIDIEIWQNLLSIEKKGKDIIKNIKKHTYDNDISPDYLKPFIHKSKKIQIKLLAVIERSNKLNNLININKYIISESNKYLSKFFIRSKEKKELMSVINLLNFSLGDMPNVISELKNYYSELSEVAFLIANLFNEFNIYKYKTSCFENCDYIPYVHDFKKYLNNIHWILTKHYESLVINKKEMKNVCSKENELCFDTNLTYFKSLEFFNDISGEIAKKYLELCGFVQKLDKYKNSPNNSYTYNFFIFGKYLTFQYLKIVKNIENVTIKITVIKEIEIDFSKALSENKSFTIYKFVEKYLEYASHRNIL